MKAMVLTSLVFTAVMLATVFAGAVPSAAEEKAEEAKRPEPVPVGPLTRGQIEAAVPGWVQAEVETEADAETARALAAVAPGAEVVVFVGTWCGDSRREVSRFWKALDVMGGMVPFEVRYVGVDREKKEPAAALAESDVRYLPTFIVYRDGRETGRIVETSPHGVERDLLDLLTGKARGVLATREDLTSEAPAKPPR